MEIYNKMFVIGIIVLSVGGFVREDFIIFVPILLLSCFVFLSEVYLDLKWQTRGMENYESD